MRDTCGNLEPNYLHMKLLLLSNSTNPGEAYLSYPIQNIKAFLGDIPKTILFIPYAAVTFSYDEYENKVNEALKVTGHQVKSIHHFEDPIKVVNEAEAIAVGGGNTWKLLRTMRDVQLLDSIKNKIEGGTPYIGWSAGSNVACPTIKTTNDMPIIDPLGFDALNLIKFQLNPHYLDVNPANHGGETREMRIEEFICQNKETTVVGLREGTMLWIEDNSIKLIGEKSARIFKFGNLPLELWTGDDFSFLNLD